VRVIMNTTKKVEEKRRRRHTPLLQRPKTMRPLGLARACGAASSRAAQTHTRTAPSRVTGAGVRGAVRTAQDGTRRALARLAASTIDTDGVRRGRERGACGLAPSMHIHHVENACAGRAWRGAPARKGAQLDGKIAPSAACPPPPVLQNISSFHSQILADVCDTVAATLGVARDTVTAYTTWAELGADSLAVVSVRGERRGVATLSFYQGPRERYLSFLPARPPPAGRGALGMTPSLIPHPLSLLILSSTSC